MAIRRTGSQTLVNRGVTAAAATPVNIVTGTGGPTVNISSIQIANSTFVAKDDTAIDTAGGFMIINGTGFQSGAVAYVQGTAATSTAFVSSSRLNVTVPALSSGLLDVYVVNTDGSGSIYLRSLNANGVPSWTTTSPLSGQVANSSFAINLVATGAAGDGTITYAVSSGSSLPPGTILSSNGYFYGTVSVGTETTYSFSVDAIDAQNQETARSFNITFSVSDPYFNLTTLLLPGDGTNNVNNNVFRDSSNNNFAITRNGNTTQGSFSPFSQTGWSNYFDGSGNGFINVLDASSVLDLPGDFTLEFWSYQNALATTNGTLNLMVSVNTLDLFQIYQDATSFVFIINSATVISTATRPAFNVWNHLAIVRSGTTVTFYLNGTSVATGSSSFSMTCASMTIGGQNRTGTTSPSSVYHGYNGYMSNFRLVKGTAVYTTNFTPSTTPLTAISGTSLLTCQSNRFVDASSNALSISPVGSTAAVQAFSPFAPTAAYSAATVGGSGYFDGTGDYLASATSTDLQLGSSDFSLEWWEYRTVLSNVDTAIVCGDGTFNAQLAYYNTGFPRFYLSTTGSSWNVFSDAATGAIAANSWNHFVLTRSGTAFRVFLNGVLSIYATGSGSVTQSTNQIFISGGINGNSLPIEGYISGVRFVKGSIPTSYQTSSTTTNTSIFTPPTAPVTTTSQGATSGDVKYLVNFTNAGITDATAKNVLETVGNAQISTTQSKFGGSSIAFDGTGDYLVFPANQNAAFGTGDFTVEAWVYVTTFTTTTGFQAIFSNRNLNSTQTSFDFGIRNSDRYLYFYNRNTDTSTFSTSGLSGVNTWIHVAIARIGSTITFYINGSSAGTVSVSTNSFGTSNVIYVGANFNTTPDTFNGYIDDLRITKGFARYTGNFTPPTSAFITR